MAQLKAQSTREGLPLLTAAGWHTAMVLKAPANQCLAVEHWGAFFKGGDAADPLVKLRLVKVSTDGTGGVAATPTKRGSGRSETVQATVAHAPDGGYSTEPTAVASSLQDQLATHPQQPFFFPVIEPRDQVVGGGERWALQYDNEGGSASLEGTFSIGWEE